MIKSPLKSKSRSHLLEEIVRFPDSKSLKLKRAANEMPLNHGAWGSPFKRRPTICAKAISTLLRESV